MLISIVSELDIDRVQKITYHQMASMYQDGLPSSLYLNQYELTELHGFSPSEWNSFLKIPEVDLFIEQEIAQIAEIGARRALAKLMEGDANSADIQAARELLSTSKLIQQRNNQREKVVVLRVPPKKEGVAYEH